MTKPLPVQADFLYLRCPEHRGRHPRKALKTMPRPGGECPHCRLVRAADPDAAGHRSGDDGGDGQAPSA
ncbi:hypothetical protein [Frankia canadensis]|nr:hypothetical protein [Frankia canadensis]